MNYFKQTKKYIKYLVTAKTRHGVHSPFVYKLIDECIYCKIKYPELKIIEESRKKLQNSKVSIEIADFGAGSKINISKSRFVSDIAKHSAKDAKYGRLLFNLCRYLNPKIGIELGTSLGISAMYQTFGADKMQLYTLEGCSNTANIAIYNLKDFPNVNVSVGPFESTLEDILSRICKLDYVFFDGNHQKQPTLDYFNKCLVKKHNDTIFIFDDIHWSEGMEEAWEIIKSHNEVTVTIDMFMVGLVFFRKEQPKEHFIIRY